MSLMDGIIDLKWGVGSGEWGPKKEENLRTTRKATLMACLDGGGKEEEWKGVE